MGGIVTDFKLPLLLQFFVIEPEDNVSGLLAILTGITELGTGKCRIGHKGARGLQGELEEEEVFGGPVTVIAEEGVREVVCRINSQSVNGEDWTANRVRSMFRDRSLDPL